MAGDNRGSSSLFRRAEQLRRWQESETNKQDLNEKPKKGKVKFSDGCVFLAAGAAGDKDELKRLLDRGADINTVNPDGITALHAACIDNNLEIVEFLVDNNADINRCDMEGWTPLHATASCGSLSMAEFLISRGADLSVVNNDGELAIDVVDEDDMARLLQEEMDRRGIDCDASRSREERHMLEDAQSWHSSGQILDKPHPKTGATALHVAAAKGYIKVMRLLLEAGADVNVKDLDGWTPLHAAAHWGQTEAVEILCDNLADMDRLNCVGQSPYDLGDDSMKPLMDELKRKQASMKLQNKIVTKKFKPSPHKERINKKERDSLRGDSDGTSSDESTHDVEKRTSSNRVDTFVDQTEVQSWRRPSLRNKTLHDDKNSKEDIIKLVSPNVSPHINDKENEVILRKDSTTTAKDERNCQEVLRIQDSNYVTTSQTNATSVTSPNKGINRSFVPPSRDDESETQRKAHAKMVRSTRRSTQGITFEDVKSAEQYMKTKQSSTNQSTLPTSISSANQSASAIIETTPANNIAITTAVNTVSNQDSSFSLENTRTKDKSRIEGVTNEIEEVTNVTIPLRKKSITADDKKDDKNSEDKSSTTREGTQAVIQRRKKAKRRSTGVVHVDMDEIDPDRKISREMDKRNEEDDDLEESVSDREGNSSKASASQNTSRAASRNSSVGAHNGDIDYKKLYEEQLAENDKLMERLRGHEKDLRMAKETIDTNSKTSNARSAIAESERREKRALERKLSEMEEELRQLQKLKAENEKLRAENRALTRVVSKLTNSATAAIGSLSSLRK